MLATLRSHIKRITIMEIVSPSSSESSHLGPGRIKILWRWQSGMPPPSPCRPPALICFLKQRCLTIFWSFDLFSQTKMSNYFLKLWFVFFSSECPHLPLLLLFLFPNLLWIEFCHVTHSKIFNATYTVKFSCYKFLIVTVKWKYAEAFRTARNVD